MLYPIQKPYNYIFSVVVFLYKIHRPPQYVQEWFSWRDYCCCGFDKGVGVRKMPILQGMWGFDTLLENQRIKVHMIRPRTVYAEEMSLFMDSSIYKRIAFIFSIVGLTVEFLSFVSPFWISKTFTNGTTINVGLWLTCVDLDCTGISNRPGKLKGWVKS